MSNRPPPSRSAPPIQRHDPVVPTKIALQIANGLRFLQKRDQHHVFFGRLSSHSVLLDDQDTVALHVTGASQVAVTVHKEVLNSPSYMFHDIVDNNSSHSDSSSSSDRLSSTYSSETDSTRRNKALLSSLIHPSGFYSSFSSSTDSTTGSSKVGNSSSRSRTRSSHTRSTTSTSSTTRTTVTTNTMSVIDGGIDHLRWRAPELSMGFESSIQSAIFSLGMIIWEMCTCEIPFNDTCAETACIRIFHGERPTLATVEDSRLVHLTEWCWSHEPQHRPSIDQVVDILKNLENTRILHELQFDDDLWRENDDVSTMTVRSIEVF
ncbi:hypothetical protein BLNAU_1342 [Blattamonas nauphoetae]|uniref:Protein kinase domain-containing protein n=1 Tax=Blattamonas nauphoetae TaxID=2049346 RepID=A0ABQ9YJ35_9EUKA|nr:hypothetical protein BLNAU_1342 [Blattamonas nauphoetae]